MVAAASESQLVAVRDMSRGVPTRAAMITQFATLAPDAPIDEAVETLLRTSQSLPKSSLGLRLLNLRLCLLHRQISLRPSANACRPPLLPAALLISP